MLSLNEKANNWKLGDDPQILIDFIFEFRNNIWEAYSISGHWTKEQEELISKFCSPPLNGIYHTTFYDGKILHCSIYDIDISFQKVNASMSFNFKDINIEIYSDYLYTSSSKIYNDSYKKERYNSFTKGFEKLLDIRELDASSLVTIIITKNKEI